jgi:hypothetical protein
MIKARNCAYASRDQGASQAEDGIVACRLINLTAAESAALTSKTRSAWKCKGGDIIIGVDIDVATAEADGTIDIGVSGDAAGDGTAVTNAIADGLTFAADSSAQLSYTVPAHGDITLTADANFSTFIGVIKLFYIPGNMNAL